MPLPAVARAKSSSKKKTDIDPSAVGSSRLWKALRQEDYAEACALIADGDHPEQREADFHWTPTLFAADAGETALLIALLEKRANLSAKCSEGNSALSVAARRGHVQAANLLIKQKANVNTANAQGWSPLAWASMAGHELVVKALLLARASMNKQDNDGRNACMWAARHGHQSVVDAMLAKGLDANLRDHAGLTAMDHAEDHLELKSAIILAEESSSRLLDAAQRDDPVAVLEILEEGAYPDSVDKEGWTPLTWAILHDSVELATVLIQHGASPCLLGEESELGRQVALPQLEVSDRISNILVANEKLLTAAKKKDWKKTSEALQSAACVEARDEAGRTALLWAARHGDLDGLRLMLDWGADLHAQDSGGNAATLSSVVSGNIEAVAYLLHSGATLGERSHEGESALHLAARANDGVTVQVLLATQMEIEDVDYRQQTPLHASAEANAAEAIAVLLQYGANPMAEDAAGRVPLAVAAAAGQYQACEVFTSSLGPLVEVPSKWAPIEEPPSEYGEEGEEEELLDPDEELDVAEIDPYADKTPTRRSLAPKASSMEATQSARRRSRPVNRALPLGAQDGKAPSIASKGSRKSMAGPPTQQQPPPTPASGAAPKRKSIAPNATPAANNSSSNNSNSNNNNSNNNNNNSNVNSTPRRQPSASKATSGAHSANPSVKGSKAVSEASVVHSTTESVVGSIGILIPDIALEGEVPSARRRFKKHREPRVKEPHEEEPAFDILRSAWLRREEQSEEVRLFNYQNALKATDARGWTPLHLATRHGHLDIVKLLISKHADLIVTDSTGRTPLMDAVALSHHALVEEMLELGAGNAVHIIDQEGRKASDLTEDRTLLQMLSRATIMSTKMPKMQSKIHVPAQAAEPATPIQVHRVRIEQLPRQFPKDVLTSELHKFCRQLGTARPVSLEVICDPVTDRPKGYAYIDFMSEEAVTRILESGHEQEFLGALLRTVPDQPSEMVRSATSN